MSRLFRNPLVWLAAAALATAVGVLVLSGDEEDGGPAQPAERQGAPAEPGGATTPRQPEAREEPPRSDREGTRADVQEAVRTSPEPRLDPGQRQVARVVRAYVVALNARAGGRACGLFVPGALAGVEFPRDRGTCAASLSASIGYRDPRGFPVYDRSRIGRIPSVAIDGSDARVVATTVTHFTGHREPSVEDDLIYLRNEHGGWLIVKPSATLYRAIGVGDIPPQVLAPP
ncbi:MAG: hypothetical protein AABM66_03250 [Actinomycetota bacterium]